MPVTPVVPIAFDDKPDIIISPPTTGVRVPVIIPIAPVERQLSDSVKALMANKTTWREAARWINSQDIPHLYWRLVKSPYRAFYDWALWEELQ